MSGISMPTLLFRSQESHKIPTRYRVAGSVLAVSLLALGILTGLACAGILKASAALLILPPGLVALGAIISLAIFAIEDADKEETKKKPPVRASAPPPQGVDEGEEEDWRVKCYHKPTPPPRPCIPPLVGMTKFDVPDLDRDEKAKIKDAILAYMHTHQIAEKMERPFSYFVKEIECNETERAGCESVFVIFYTPLAHKPKYLAYATANQAERVCDTYLLFREYKPMEISDTESESGSETSEYSEQSIKDLLADRVSILKIYADELKADAVEKLPPIETADKSRPMIFPVVAKRPGWPRVSYFPSVEARDQALARRLVSTRA